MPMLSNCISMTRDGQYIFVTGLFKEKNKIDNRNFLLLFIGSYKPRVRCYDVHELSLKFERCFDNECIQMKILSEDYSKVRKKIFFLMKFILYIHIDCIYAC